ncbi:MAG: hypothetical protein ABI459_06350 [Deltaproteobacteria bacterium]
MADMGQARTRLAMLAVVTVILGNYGYQFYKGSQQGQQASAGTDVLEQIAATRSGDFQVITALSEAAELAIENKDIATAQIRLQDIVDITNGYQSWSKEAHWAMLKLGRMEETARKNGLHQFAFAVITEDLELSLRLLGPDNAVTVALVEIYDKGPQTQ